MSALRVCVCVRACGRVCLPYTCMNMCEKSQHYCRSPTPSNVPGQLSVGGDVYLFVCLYFCLFVCRPCCALVGACGRSFTTARCCYLPVLSVLLLSLESSFISFCLISVRAWNGQYNLNSVCKFPTQTHTHTRAHTLPTNVIFSAAIAIRKYQIYNKSQKVWISNFYEAIWTGRTSWMALPSALRTA